MSIPQQASFSSATTAVASRRTAYPSVEELASFKLPLKPCINEPTCDDVSHSSNESVHIRHLTPHPSTPTPASPITTETSDRDFIADDSPSTVHGESMFYPRHPLANRTPSTNIPVSPHWPFQDATPRLSVMVPITQGITESSRAFNLGTRSSRIGQVSVTESLDEFQVNHPNANLLSLHPRPLTYSLAPRSLAKVPELVEKPQRNVQSKQAIPTTQREKPLTFLHSRRQSRHLFKLHLRHRREKRNSSVKPKTFWYQRLSISTKIFRGSASITMFFLVNSFVSTSALITLATARLNVPHGVVVWVIVSLSTCVFTLIILYLMRKFRNAVLYDEEHRGRSSNPKNSFDTHMGHMQLPASPSEIYHRRQLGAAVEQELGYAEQMNNEIVKSPRGLETNHVIPPSPFGQPFDSLVPFSPRDAIDNYWISNSFISSAHSDASSMTAVITSSPKAPTTKPEIGLPGTMKNNRNEPRSHRDAENELSPLEFENWDGWLDWD
ncbi:uncharacterized protein ColSpa_09699 [Colletotrichum spaethianum]|uniref:Uncharacterized protein n=1 Tax=Colletotrichum spaethianum TaxID=700344 RepID=A0AA37US86_9PEZI|nr:uncharacterized protein ColSpa_09699 [Colletotrichum spaethianum]GKT49518.1 hypothetical protein ColSpa_09699 [Colletotrichum spaethianum]